jgi:hypothetical protein
MTAEEVVKLVNQKNQAEKDLGILKEELAQFTKMLGPVIDHLKGRRYSAARAAIGDGLLAFGTDLSRLRAKLARFDQLSENISEYDEKLRSVNE